MKKIFCVLVSVTAVLVSSNIRADAVHGDENIYPACHAQAMIGFDSVINSRLGVPAELAIDVTDFRYDLSPAKESYLVELLTTMMTAYQWKDSPQDYYVLVFNQCIENSMG